MERAFRILHCNQYTVGQLPDDDIFITCSAIPDAPGLCLSHPNAAHVAVGLKPGSNVGMQLAVLTEAHLCVYYITRACVAQGATPEYVVTEREPDPARLLSFCCFSPDGHTVLVCADQSARIYSVTGDRVVQTKNISTGRPSDVTVLHASFIGQDVIVAVHSDGECQLWDIAEDRLVFTIRDCVGHPLVLSAVANNKLVLIDNLGEVFIFNIFDMGDRIPATLIARCDLAPLCTPAPEAEADPDPDSPKLVTARPAPGKEWQMADAVPGALSLEPLDLAIRHVPTSEARSFDTHVALVLTPDYIIALDVYSLAPVYIAPLDRFSAATFTHRGLGLLLAGGDYTAEADVTGVVLVDLGADMHIPALGHPLSRLAEFPVDSILCPKLIQPGSAGRPEKKRPGSAAVKNKPVTFHSKVRSSGYGSKEPVMAMFGKKKAPRRPPPRPALAGAYPVDRTSFVTRGKWLGQRDSVTVTRFSLDGFMAAVGSTSSVSLHRLDAGLTDQTAPFRPSPDKGRLIPMRSSVKDVAWLGQSYLAVASGASVDVFNLGEGRHSSTPLVRVPAQHDVTSTVFPYIPSRRHRPILLSSARGRVAVTELRLDTEVRDIKTYGNASAAKERGGVSLDCSVNMIDMINVEPSVHVAAACGDMSLRILDFGEKNGATSLQIDDAHSRAVTGVRVPNHKRHPLADTVLTSGRDGLVKLWDTRGPTCIATLSHGMGTAGAPVSAQYSPCGRFIASGHGCSVHVYDVRCAASIVKLDTARGGVVTTLDWCPRAPLILSGTAGGDEANGVFAHIG